MWFEYKTHQFCSLVLLSLAFLSAAAARAESEGSVNGFVSQLEAGNCRTTLDVGGSEVAIEWKERSTSFSASDGIRTFLAYRDGALVGAASVMGDVATGELTIGDCTYELRGDGSGQLAFLPRDASGACGNCGCENTMPVAAASRSLSAKSASVADPGGLIYNSGVLRKYRLALLVTAWCNYTPDNVGTFLASTEAFLNEVYYRDFGICFEVVHDPNLLRTSSNALTARTDTGYTILSRSKGYFSQCIDESDYDLGFVVHPLSYDTAGGVGYADVSAAYRLSMRTSGVAINSPRTIAHEIGHMFGADHTFIESNTYANSASYQTELGVGQSLMGTEKAVPRNFISLVTVQDMRDLQNRYCPLFYVDDARTLVGSHDGATKPVSELTDAERAMNIVRGVQTGNHAPAIDRTKLKDSYIVPPGVFIQFDIPATDADGDALTYTVQQADVGNADATHFRTNLGGSNSCVMVGPDYYEGALMEYSTNVAEAGKTYTFWLAASDPRAYASDAFAANPQAVGYDVHQSAVQVRGTQKLAVACSPNIMSTCYEGYKVNLTWAADTQVFDETSRFRIRFSKDGGQTYDTILKDNVRALDNACSVYIPYGIGTDIYTTRGGKQVRRCLLKLEHVGGAACLEFPANYTSGTIGFYISTGTRPTFTGLPTERYLEVTEDEIPEPPANVQCRNGSATKTFTYTETRSDDGKWIFRVWETENYGRHYGFEQIIKIVEPEIAETVVPLPARDGGTQQTVRIPHDSPWMTAYIQRHPGDYEERLLGDSDGDGFTDAEEYVVGTDPHDAADRLRITEFHPNGGIPVVRYEPPSNPGVAKFILQGSSKPNGPWKAHSGFSMTHRFFRVVATPVE